VNGCSGRKLGTSAEPRYPSPKVGSWFSLSEGMIIAALSTTLSPFTFGPTKRHATMSLPPKRIVIFCDGTGQSEYDPKNRFTNVSRIKRYIKGQTVDGTQQSCYYVPGIGTEGYFQDKFHQANAKGECPDQFPILIAIDIMEFFWLPVSAHSGHSASARVQEFRDQPNRSLDSVFKSSSMSFSS
jgi:hypothetical protein